VIALMVRLPVPSSYRTALVTGQWAIAGPAAGEVMAAGVAGARSAREAGGWPSSGVGVVAPGAIGPPVADRGWHERPDVLGGKAPLLADLYALEVAAAEHSVHRATIKLSGWPPRPNLRIAAADERRISCTYARDGSVPARRLGRRQSLD